MSEELIVKEGETPFGVAELIADVIKGKTVVDVGCGDGSFLEALRDNGAQKLIGIEEVTSWAWEAAEKGFSILQGSSWFQPLPDADVYYLWTKDAMGVYLKAKHEGITGTFVFGHTVRKSLLEFINSLEGEKRYLPDSDWWVFITKL